MTNLKTVEEQIKALTKTRAELKEELRKEGCKAQKLLKAQYTYGTSTGTFKAGMFINKELEGIEYIVLKGTLTNQSEYDAHLEKYGSLFNSPSEFTSSVKYFRIKLNPEDTAGALYYEGGGNITLKSHIFCSDDQWEELKRGIIPDELRR